MSPLLQDSWFLAKLNRAIARHGRRWSLAQTRAFQEQMALTFETNPKVRALLRIVRPDLDRRLRESEQMLTS